MLRELQTQVGKNIDAMYKADVVMKVGMAVVKNFVDKTADLPAAATKDGFFFVSKERVPTGLNCAQFDMSDYDANFIDIAVGEPVKLIPLMIGERYATDQYVATGLSVGNALMVGADGKFAKATATSVPTRFIYGGTYVDAGHTLAIVEVSAVTVTNA
jgi:hypothetical protein